MIIESIRNNILNSLFAKGGSISSGVISTSTNCYIGLSTTTPSLTSDESAISNFTEPTSGTGYKRVLIGNSTQSATQKMDIADAGEITNGNQFIFFDEATAGGGGYGTVTHFGLFASQMGGSPILVGALTTPITVNEGYVLIFRPGDLSVSID